jgi:hypothetical protein
MQVELTLTTTVLEIPDDKIAGEPFEVMRQVVDTEIRARLLDHVEWKIVSKREVRSSDRFPLMPLHRPQQ